jgi:hypothetical protein
MEDIFMSKFPRTEAEVLVLGTSVKEGLTTHKTVYPDPPVGTEALTGAIAALQVAMTQVKDARAAAEAATEVKLTALETLMSLLKKDISYAENTVGNDDAKLKLIGWSARKDPTPLQAPGQTGLLMVYPQGEGWLELQWSAPIDGGKPATYQLQRRLKIETAWTGILTTYERKVVLQNQPRGVELEYCVFASNKAGDGPASNTVMVVL